MINFIIPYHSYAEKKVTSSMQFRKCTTRAKTLPLHFSARERSWQSKIWKSYIQSSIPITKYFFLTICTEWVNKGFAKCSNFTVHSCTPPKVTSKVRKGSEAGRSVHLWNIHQFIWFISFILEFSCFSALLNEPLQCSLHRAALEEYSEATIVHNALVKAIMGISRYSHVKPLLCWIILTD